MAPKDSSVLRQILDGQIEMATKLETMNTRLFGGEGQKGVIPIIFEKHENLASHVQGVKDEALKAVQDTKDKELKELEKDVTDLKTKATLTMWKTGAISSLAGSGLGIGATLLAKWLLGAH
jgi:hypothetical protein